MKAGQEELKKDIVWIKEFSNIIQEKMNAMENKVTAVETKVLKIEESLEQKVLENFEEALENNSRVKAFHLAASLRRDVADIIETLPEEQRHDFQALSGALELRFGGKCTKEYSRLQLKSRYQNAGESLQESADDIQRLSHLAFSDCPVETRQDLALQHFIDSVRDLEIQKALRLIKDIGSALTSLRT
ncbi:retrovirus-related Pol polyprotein from transposon 412 [Nephila pilipes]|uniref:Retrovirus-related Pol polyprotein from transposon 412 n=1 Tax=Nephila pilipes TaxID=299642 RepID=A0A8X6N298_NEPPI|nr:retrovirus-related Pol polyprotein from transposon 412 [Nephila pilipes]